MFVELALTSSSDAGDGTTYLWNLHTGSMLGSFKQNICPLQSLALVNNPRNLGSLFLSSQAEKGMMHVYSFQKVAIGQNPQTCTLSFMIKLLTITKLPWIVINGS